MGVLVSFTEGAHNIRVCDLYRPQKFDEMFSARGGRVFSVNILKLIYSVLMVKVRTLPVCLDCISLIGTPLRAF